MTPAPTRGTANQHLDNNPTSGTHPTPGAANPLTSSAPAPITDSMRATLDEFRTHLLVPVVVISREEQAVPLMRALVAGGLPVAEVTFRTSAAAAGIRAISDDAELAGTLVGAGTVVTVEQAEAAASAGAQFAVSPGLSRAVVERSVELGMAPLPGAVTATEIMAALDMGLDTVKFFPAATSGGAKAIKALSAPFGSMSFVPTGGINGVNLGEYLAMPSVAAVGGSWMVPSKLIEAGDWGAITELTKAAMRQAREIRG